MIYGGRNKRPRGTTRERIVAAIRQSPQAITTPQLIERLGIAKSVAFHHLTALEAGGYIERRATAGGGHALRWAWRDERRAAA